MMDLYAINLIDPNIRSSTNQGHIENRLENIKKDNNSRQILSVRRDMNFVKIAV